MFIYRNYFQLEKHIAVITEIASCILSQYLWYPESIQVDKTSVYC